MSKQDAEQVELHLRDINISKNQVKPIIMPFPYFLKKFIDKIDVSKRIT